MGRHWVTSALYAPSHWIITRTQAGSPFYVPKLLSEEGPQTQHPIQGQRDNRVRFSAPNRKAAAPAVAGFTPPAVTQGRRRVKPQPRGASRNGPPGAAQTQTAVSRAASSELIPLRAVSTRGSGAEGSIWPGGGAWRPRGGRGAGEPAEGGRHHLPPRSVHRPPNPGRRAGGSERRCSPVRPRGKRVASEAAAEPKSAAEADGPAASSRPRLHRPHARATPLTPPLRAGLRCRPPQLPTPTRKITRDRASQLSSGSRENNI